jgi:hypothetical protein
MNTFLRFRTPPFSLKVYENSKLLVFSDIVEYTANNLGIFFTIR